MWVAEQPVFLRKPWKSVLAPAREEHVGNPPEPRKLAPGSQALQWLVNYQHSLWWISSRGECSQARSKPRSLCAPWGTSGADQSPLHPTPTGTVLVWSNGNPLLLLCLPIPSARLLFAHPHLPSEDARGGGLGEVQNTHIFALCSLNRCCLRSSHALAWRQVLRSCGRQASLQGYI